MALCYLILFYYYLFTRDNDKFIITGDIDVMFTVLLVDDTVIFDVRNLSNVIL